MTGALTAEARSVLRQIGHWPIADLLLNPEQGASHLRNSGQGGTLRDPRDAYYQCERRGVEVYEVDVKGYDEQGFAEGEITHRTLLLIRWPQIARCSRELPAGVRDELRAARDHHRAIYLAYALRHDHLPPGASHPPFDRDAFDAHMAEWAPAVDRLEAALDAALLDELAAPVQLDLFGAVA